MILLTLNVTSEPTSECRPCGHMEARAMALHRRGGIYHYHFWVMYAVLLKTDLIPRPWTCSLLLLRCPRLREENIRLRYALEGSVD